MSNSLFQAIDNLTAAVESLRAKLESGGQQSISIQNECCPHPVLDCETGEITWVYPPKKIGGNEGGTVVTRDGAVSIHDAIDAIGPDGMADGEYDFGENDGSGRGYTTTTDPDATICDNANWFVYSCSGLMDDIASTWGILNFSLDTLTSLIGGWGLIGTTPLFYVTAGSAAAATFITVGVSAALIVAVLELIDKLLSLAGAGLKAQWSSQLEADLVCAIVTGANTGGGDGIKREWDRVINIYVPAINPLRWYYKYLLTKDMANALAKGQLQEGEAKYGYGCSCAGGGYPKVAIWKSYDGGSTWNLDRFDLHYYIWPDGEGDAEEGDQGCPWNASRFTFSDSDSSYDPTCRRNHNGDLNGYRIRETTGVGAQFRANTNPPYCDSWGIGLTIPADGSWLDINQSTEDANIWRGDNGDFNIEIEVQP